MLKVQDDSPDDITMQAFPAVVPVLRCLRCPVRKSSVNGLRGRVYDECAVSVIVLSHPIRQRHPQ